MIPNRPLAPGVAELLADTIPLAAPLPRPAKPQHESHFLPSGGKRLKSIDLEYPLSFDGREFRTIVVKRLTVAEVGAYFATLEELRKTDDATVLPFPMFVDEGGAPIPDGLLDALDDDDMTRLNKEAVDFLPRRFRIDSSEAQTSGSPSPGAGDTSGSSSVTSPAGA